MDTYSHSICYGVVSHLRKDLTFPVYAIAHIKATPGHHLKRQNLCQGTMNQQNPHLSTTLVLAPYKLTKVQNYLFVQVIEIKAFCIKDCIRKFS